MTKEDLKNYTREELEEIFLNLINEMETTGNKFVDSYTKHGFNLDNYVYGSALLIRVSRTKSIISMKNSEEK